MMRKFIAGAAAAGVAGILYGLSGSPKEAVPPTNLDLEQMVAATVGPLAASEAAFTDFTAALEPVCLENIGGYFDPLKSAAVGTIRSIAFCKDGVQAFADGRLLYTAYQNDLVANYDAVMARDVAAAENFSAASGLSQG